VLGVFTSCTFLVRDDLVVFIHISRLVRLDVLQIGGPHLGLSVVILELCRSLGYGSAFAFDTPLFLHRRSPTERIGNGN